MEGSPYSNILGIISEEGYNKNISVNIGKVLSPSPLSIELNGVTYDEEDLFISETFRNLMNNHIGLVTVTHLSGPGDALVKEEDIKVRPVKQLKSGDSIIVLVDLENSDFYIIDRVV